MRDPGRGAGAPLLVALLLLLVLGSPLWDHPWATLRPTDPSIWREPWRLLLGHWLHPTWAHLGLNTVALAGWLVLWEETVSRRIAAIAITCLLTGAGIVAISPRTEIVGLSGALHGLYAASAVAGLGQQKARAVSLVALTILSVKLLAENVLGPSATTETFIGMPVATEAHWIGAAAGLSYAAGRRAAAVAGWPQAT